MPDELFECPACGETHVCSADAHVNAGEHCTCGSLMNYVGEADE